MAHVAWDADAGAAVGHAGGELVDAGRLVEARQAPGVVQPSFGVVGTDVVLVALAQLLDGLLDVLETSIFPHVLGAEVGVTASTVPVPRDGFGIEGHNDTKVFAHPVEDETCYPEVIPHLNPFARSHLELPLGWHHFCVGSSNFHTSIQARSVVGLHNVSAIGFVSSYTAVVRTLGSREAIGRPAKRMTICSQKGVLLLHPKPGVLVGHHIHNPPTGVPKICVCRLAVVFEDLTEN